MTFEGVLGHRDIHERLGRAMRGGRLGSAYLFVGPAGVGRKLTALAWAQALNCERSIEGYPYACGGCRPCRLIATRQYPDLVVVEPEEGKDLKIEQVRELLQVTRLRPYEGRKRVFIVDGADRLTDAAANALLKTLEEPRETSLLVLLAETEGAVLPTIRSRCQIVRFAALPLDLVTKELVAKGASEAQARWLAYDSGGSLGRALEMFGRMSDLQALREEVCRARQKALVEPTGAFSLAAKYKDAETVGPFLRLLKAYYRDAIVLKTQGAKAKLLNQDYRDAIEGEAAAHSLADLLDRFGSIEWAERRIEDFNANKQLVLEQLLQELAPQAGWSNGMEQTHYQERSI